MIFAKTLTTLAATAALLAPLVQADMLQISNPTQGTTWKVGETVFLQWKGNCASMGPTAKTVDVDLMTGDANALRFVAKLASIDCSGSNSRKEFQIPPDVVLESGKYSLSVQTIPQLSYSNIFMIETGTGAASGPGAPAGGSEAAPGGANGGGSVLVGEDANGQHSAAGSLPIKNAGLPATASAVALAAVFIAAQLL